MHRHVDLAGLLKVNLLDPHCKVVLYGGPIDDKVMQIVTENQGATENGRLIIVERAFVSNDLMRPLPSLQHIFLQGLFSTSILRTTLISPSQNTDRQPRPNRTPAPNRPPHPPHPPQHPQPTHRPSHPAPRIPSLLDPHPEILQRLLPTRPLSRSALQSAPRWTPKCGAVDESEMVGEGLAVSA